MSSSTLGAVILAAGRGQRLGSELPKAFVSLKGKPLLLHSIEKFAQHEPISEIIVVINEDDTDLLEQAVLRNLQIPGEICFEVAIGGRERQDSALAGVQISQTDWIFVHDAARPLFPIALLDPLYLAAQSQKAAIPTLPVPDSIRRIDSNQIAIEDIDREGVHLVQTPQCYLRELLHEALEAAREAGSYFTDEAAAVMTYKNIRAKSIEGARENFKITTDWDLLLAEAIVHSPELSG